MRTGKLAIIVGAVIACLMVGRAGAEVTAGIKIDQDGLKGFYLAIGDHFKVAAEQIDVAREERIADEELPVVFFLAKRSGVAPDVIIKLRHSGKSWMEITTDFGLNAGIFYVPVSGNPGPPYGKAYGHFRSRGRSDWGHIWMSDDDVVNFVNLRFISEHYDYSPDEVIKMRQNGNGFVDINAKVKINKAKHKGDNAKFASDEKVKEKGKGKKKK